MAVHALDARSSALPRETRPGVLRRYPQLRRRSIALFDGGGALLELSRSRSPAQRRQYDRLGAVLGWRDVPLAVDRIGENNDVTPSRTGSRYELDEDSITHQQSILHAARRHDKRLKENKRQHNETAEGGEYEQPRSGADSGGKVWIAEREQFAGAHHCAPT